LLCPFGRYHNASALSSFLEVVVFLPQPIKAKYGSEQLESSKKSVLGCSDLEGLISHSFLNGVAVSDDSLLYAEIGQNEHTVEMLPREMPLEEAAEASPGCLPLGIFYRSDYL